MGDSSVPVVPPAQLPAFAFYIGGDTPHIWSPAEIRQLTARYGLPIWVNVNPAADGVAMGRDIVARLRAMDWPRGSAVVLDIENIDQEQVILAVEGAVAGGGYELMVYESKGALPSMETYTGLRWVADWTGLPHLYPGSEATQYASAEMAGLAYDASVIEESVPLAEINPPAVHRIPQVPVAVTLPELARGDKGPAVKRLQHLILAWHGGELATAGPDGIFGPETTAALRSFQRVYGITVDAGTATAETWARLLTG
jgi:hypothetical protein